MASSDENSPEIMRRVRLTLIEKMEILNRLEKGETTPFIAERLGLSPNYVKNSILQKQNEIIESSKALGLTAAFVKSMRNKLVVETEEMLWKWIQDCFRQMRLISKSIIQTKAREYHAQLNKKYGKNDTFKAGKDWYYGFQNRYALHSLTGIVQNTYIHVLL
ncbi:hypothetical protein TKK_0014305 [Trichogramma kaykai]|uniref:HTH CENPB-type domain-containing protein n=1 Tax=Trichogramma kaykai TaxID=54128 RepID=A0ABD2WE93_9HYME